MKYKVTLNKRVYEVEVERGEAILADEYDAAAPVQAAAPAAAAPVVQAAAPAPAPAAASLKAGEVIASPLPGNILTVKVAEGESVKKGQVLLTIEAMKMENEVMSPRDGAVLQIAVKQGAVVDTGAPLVVLG